MSSGAGGEATIGAIILPATGVAAVGVAAVGVAVLGAGWLAWNSGKLLVAGGQKVAEANRAINAEIAQKKAEKERNDVLKKQRARAGYEKVLQVGAALQKELDACTAADQSSQAELTALKQKLEKLLQTPAPAEAERLETVNSVLLARLKEIQERISSFRMSESVDKGADNVQDMLAALERSFAAAPAETRGFDIQAPDPEAVERARLNERLNTAAAAALSGWDFIKEYSQTVGISVGSQRWIESCLGDAQARIPVLCDPAISNADLRDGVQRLEEDVRQFEEFVPALSLEQANLLALYEVYVQAAQVMGERVRPLPTFNASKKALEGELRRLGERAERAQECARIYQSLGKAGYLCYAWDQVLQEMGYAVHTHEYICKLAGKDLDYATQNDRTIPFYAWGPDKLAQFYQVADNCDLQLVVHKDGTISMQTIAGQQDDAVKDIQKKHCERLKKVRERLQRDWFINYDAEEFLPPETVMTAAQWLGYVNGAKSTAPEAATLVGSRNQEQRQAQAQALS